MFATTWRNRLNTSLLFISKKIFLVVLLLVLPLQGYANALEQLVCEAADAGTVSSVAADAPAASAAVMHDDSEGFTDHAAHPCCCAQPAWAGMQYAVIQDTAPGGGHGASSVVTPSGPVLAQPLRPPARS